MNDYLVETSDGAGLMLTARSDMEAAVTAKAELVARGLYTTGLNLFRYPLAWTKHKTAGLIWVPIFRFI